MLIKGLKDEDFVNYKLPCLFIVTSFCTFKCDIESGTSCCQNSSLAKQPANNVSDDLIIHRYLDNPITKSIVFGGLEPIEQFGEIYRFIDKLRNEYKCQDDVVIYTGFNKDEISEEIKQLKTFENIVIKFGRFVPDKEKKYDDVLGITLSSPNQYAERIS